MSSKTSNDLVQLLQGAAQGGTLSAQTSQMLTGNLGAVVVAGAAGLAAEDITASDVTLVTVLIDASSSIHARGLEASVREGQNLLLDAFSTSKERESILVALWTFNDDVRVVHAYVGLDDATRLDDKNYAAVGATRLYDTWCDACTANVAYAQRLRDSGTPCRSVVVIVTDGEDVGSRRSAAECKRLNADLLASEQFYLGFVGVGSDVDFHAVARAMGIPDGSVAVQKQATPTTVRQIFRLVSQSAIRASQAKIAPGPNAGFFAP